MIRTFTPVIKCPSCKVSFKIEYDRSWRESDGKWIECHKCRTNFGITYEWKISSVCTIISSKNIDDDLVIDCRPIIYSQIAQNKN
jgi:Zn ribbon nucleic-acid-binding protein